jgi:DNA-binding MarR family transcriptional regulator
VLPAKPDDDDIVTWWGLVIEGYQATHVKLLDEIARRLNLTPAPFDVLLRLVRSPGHRKPMSQLAAEAALTTGGFTKVADRMVAAGLLKREQSTADRRMIYAVLTPLGVRTAEDARRECADILRATVLAPLGLKEATALADAMRTLREANSTREAVATRETGTAREISTGRVTRSARQANGTRRARDSRVSEGSREAAVSTRQPDGTD